MFWRSLNKFQKQKHRVLTLHVGFAHFRLRSNNYALCLVYNVEGKKSLEFLELNSVIYLFLHSQMFIQSNSVERSHKLYKTMDIIKTC